MDRPVVVIGDLILDKTVYTTVRGISPEDPSCLVAIGQDTAYNLGGAANVAYNAHCLGGSTTLVSAVGTRHVKDHMKVQEMICEAGFDWVAAMDREGSICRKTRYMADRAMLLRVDRETKAKLTEHNWSVPALCGRAMSVADYFKIVSTRHLKPVVAVVDYGKGVFEDPVPFSRFNHLTAECLRIVDPGRNGAWQRYSVGTTIYKANLSQTQQFCEQRIANWPGFTGDLGPTAYEQIAKHAVRCLNVADRIHFAALVITLGPGGAVLVTPDGRTEHIPAQARQLIDVCGAGDSFMAGMAVRLARTWSGGPSVSFEDLKSAAMYGNAVASVAVQQPGVVAVRKEQLDDSQQLG